MNKTELENKIFNDDCFEVLKKIDDNCIDLIVTDPPYCINYKKWDKKDFSEFTERWVSECFRILKPNGTFWGFMGYQNVIEFISILNKYGKVHLENWVVWARGKGRASSKHLKSTREDIIHVTKSDNYVWNSMKIMRENIAPYRDKNGKPKGWFIAEDGKRYSWTGLGNVWVYTQPFISNSKNYVDFLVHPSQKPVALIERLIKLSSNEGDVVFDPFLGSGTTTIAALNSNRKYSGIEKENNYYSKICERIKKWNQDKDGNLFKD